MATLPDRIVDQVGRSVKRGKDDQRGIGEDPEANRAYRGKRRKQKHDENKSANLKIRHYKCKAVLVVANL